LQALLQTHSRRAFLVTSKHGGVDGYLITQKKRIGPWVMQSSEKAELMLKAALSLPFPGPISVVVPSENMDAVTLLQNHGFKIVRVNQHMVRGSVGQFVERTKIFAQTSLSLG